MSQATKPTTQAEVFGLLAQLAGEGAPDPEWTVYADAARIGQVMGRLMLDTDTEQHKALAVWQRIIGAGPVKVEAGARTDLLSVSGSYEGLAVRIVALVWSDRGEEL